MQSVCYSHQVPRQKLFYHLVKQCITLDFPILLERLEMLNLTQQHCALHLGYVGIVAAAVLTCRDLSANSDVSCKLSVSGPQLNLELGFIEVTLVCTETSWTRLHLTWKICFVKILNWSWDTAAIERNFFCALVGVYLHLQKTAKHKNLKLAPLGNNKQSHISQATDKLQTRFSLLHMQ